MHRRAHRARREAPAFFVAPRDELHRAARFHTRLVDRLERFQCREDAVHAVEATAARLTVHMAAGDDRRGCAVQTGPPHEHVADGIHRDAEVARGSPRQQQTPGLDIFGRERGAIHTVAGDFADLCHLHVTPPQTFLVDAPNGVLMVFSHFVQRFASKQRDFRRVCELLDAEHRIAQLLDLRRRQRFDGELFELLDDVGFGSEFVFAAARRLDRAFHARAVLEMQLDAHHVPELGAFRRDLLIVVHFDFLCITHALGVGDLVLGELVDEASRLRAGRWRRSTAG